jgi:Flp pilus assembly protein CpaB
MGNILAPFKKFLSNKNTVAILGVLLGLVVLYFGYIWRVNQSVKPVNVPYASATLTSGTKITEEQIGYTEIPAEFLANMTNIVTDAGSIRDMLVSYDAKIPVNSFFFTESLISEDEMPDSVFSNLPDGHTIFFLDADSETTYSNSIFPGDTIDLYIKTTSDEDGKLVFARFIKEIEVLAVKDADGKNVFANRDEPGEPESMLFSVPEDLFLLLSKAKYLGSFEIIPVPRNNAYSASDGSAEIQATIIEEMILDKTYVIPNECTDLTLC